MSLYDVCSLVSKCDDISMEYGMGGANSPIPTSPPPPPLNALLYCMI